MSCMSQVFNQADGEIIFNRRDVDGDGALPVKNIVSKWLARVDPHTRAAYATFAATCADS